MVENQKKILIVDDILDWRDTLSGILEDEGYQVKSAESSESALNLLEHEKFDLAVLDLRLDETDEDNEEGLELRAKIKQTWPSTKVVMITGYPSVDAVINSRQPGAEPVAEAFIVKTEADKLPEIVKKLLSS